MVHEARKTNKLRPPVFFETYLQGNIIDIGSGGAPVTPTALRFDKPQGDAQHITSYVAPGSFDCVHSSHCLEHMRDCVGALKNWWQLVKPGGYLIFVVPDEDLYEQGAWPSLFNPDHKATFRLGKTDSWSPVSFEVKQLAQKVPEAEVLSIRRMTDGYDARYCRQRINKLQRIVYKILWPAIGGFQFVLGRYAPKIYPLLMLCGWPIDQTIGPAVAQIEVILRKPKVIST